MDLRSFFESKAGLSGRPLQLAVEACEANCIEELDDLRLAAKNESAYLRLFPQVGLQTRISVALAKAEDQVVAPSSLQSSKDHESAKTTYGQDLPEGKRFSSWHS